MNLKFLDKVKVKNFCDNPKMYSSTTQKTERKVVKRKNRNPENIYTIIGYKSMNLGTVEYDGDLGYYFCTTGRQKTYLVANKLSERFYVAPEDVELED